MCSDCVIKPKKNFFNCEMQRDCNFCLNLKSQMKTYSSDINMLKRKPANKYHQMLPFNIGEQEPKQNNNDFESAREILMTDYRVIVERRFEMIYNAIETLTYTKYEDIPENKVVHLWIQTY